jgi:dimethylamine monooxygenase subunit A
LHQIHAPVPEFGEGTRNASLIERMFDNLDPARIVIRWNWSLHNDMELYHPHSNSGPGRRFGEGDLRGQVILRLERQTLRKLPISGDVLFTIRIQVDPLEVLEKHPDGPKLAQAIDTQLQAMDAAQLDYKGLSDERARLSARLKQIAER